MLCANGPSVVDSRTLSNLVVDYVSFRFRSRQANALGIHAYMNSIRTPRKLQVVEELLRYIHAHCLSKHGMPGCREVDAYKFMSAYLFADRMPAHEQESLHTARTREAAQPLMETFSAIIARLRWLGSSASLDAVADDLTTPFLSQLTAFYNAHDGFAGITRERLITRIEHVLVALYQQRFIRVRDGVDPLWLAVCDTQIVRLREQYVLFVGVEALDRLHARMTGENGLHIPAI